MKKSKRDIWLDTFIAQSHTGYSPKIYTTFVTGSGKYSKYSVDHTLDNARYFDRHGCTVVAGNDSPRGGKLGDYIRITTRCHPKLKSERYIKIHLNVVKGFEVY